LPPKVKLDAAGGVLYLGTKGKMLQGSTGSRPRLLPVELHNRTGAPRERLPRVPNQAHEMNFVNAIRGRDAVSCPFSYAAHLTEIMMAQDFHDLTGQVIARVVNLAATIEDQLVQLLIQTAPPNAHVPAAAEAKPAHLQGPVVDPENTPDVVTDQSQVDDLLASLGF